MTADDRSVADIQITPAVLKLERRPWQGQFQVTITNQLPRPAVFNVSVVAGEGASAVRLALTSKDKLVKLDEDGTYTFELGVTGLPKQPDSSGKPAPEQSASFHVQCAEDSDMHNLVATSESREVLVSGAAAAPAPRTWLYAVLALAGVLVIGGAVTAGILLSKKKPGCGPESPCPAGQECKEEMCVDLPPPPSGKKCVPAVGQTCNHCGGKLTCEGACDKPDPKGFGQSCNDGCPGKIGCDGKCDAKKPPTFGRADLCRCGGKIGCNGRCDPPDPNSLGQSCGHCGGVWACGGLCTVPDPPGFGTTQVKYKDGVVVLANQEKKVGGSCSSRHTFEKVQVVDNGGKCIVTHQGSAIDCSVIVRGQNALLPSSCTITITERRGCD
jgi:hypothetical protein